MMKTIGLIFGVLGLSTFAMAAPASVLEADTAAIDETLASAGPPAYTRQGSPRKIGAKASTGEVTYEVKTDDGETWTFTVKNFDIEGSGVHASVEEWELAGPRAKRR